MSAVLSPARSSRTRCLLELAARIADRARLNRSDTAVLVHHVKQRIAHRVSAAMNLTQTRAEARLLSPITGDAMGIPVRIHQPPSTDATLMVQTFAAKHPSGEPHNLVGELLVVPGDTVLVTVMPGGAVVITEGPQHER